MNTPQQHKHTLEEQLNAVDILTSLSDAQRKTIKELVIANNTKQNSLWIIACGRINLSALFAQELEKSFGKDIIIVDSEALMKQDIDTLQEVLANYRDNNPIIIKPLERLQEPIVIQDIHGQWYDKFLHSKHNDKHKYKWDKSLGKQKGKKPLQRR